MSHNYLDAFTYLFKHKNWFAKLLVGSLLFFFIKLIELAIKVLNTGEIAQLNPEILLTGTPSQIALYTLMSIGGIVLCLLSIWMSATLCGYFITAIRRYMRGQEDAIPDWDGVMGKLFFRGFKVFMGMFFISLLGYLFSQLVANYSLFLVAISSFHASLLVAFLGIFVCLYVSFLIPALIMSFCEKDKFFSLFNLVRAKQIAAKSLGQYFLMLLKLLSIVIISSCCVVLFFPVKIGIIILPFIFFYLLIVYGNLIAQYYVLYCKEE